MWPFNLFQGPPSNQGGGIGSDYASSMRNNNLHPGLLTRLLAATGQNAMGDLSSPATPPQVSGNPTPQPGLFARIGRGLMNNAPSMMGDISGARNPYENPAPTGGIGSDPDRNIPWQTAAPLPPPRPIPRAVPLPRPNPLTANAQAPSPMPWWQQRPNPFYRGPGSSSFGANDGPFGGSY